MTHAQATIARLTALSLFFLASLAGGPLAGDPARAATAPGFQKKFQALATESAKAKPSCDRYLAELKKAAGPLAGDDAQYPSREAALAVLEQLARNPGVPAATQEAGRLVVAQPVPKDLDPTPLLRAAGSLQPWCGTVDQLRHVKRLAEGADRYALTAEERGKLKAIVLDFIDREAAAPGPLAPPLVQIAALGALDRAALFGAPGKHEASIRAVSDDGAAIKKRIDDRIRRKQDKSDADFLDDFLFELREVEPLRAKVRQLRAELAS